MADIRVLRSAQMYAAYPGPAVAFALVRRPAGVVVPYERNAPNFQGSCRRGPSVLRTAATEPRQRGRRLPNEELELQTAMKYTIRKVAKVLSRPLKPLANKALDRQVQKRT